MITECCLVVDKSSIEQRAMQVCGSEARSRSKRRKQRMRYQMAVAGEIPSICTFLPIAFHQVTEAGRFWWASRFITRDICIQS